MRKFSGEDIFSFEIMVKISEKLYFSEIVGKFGGDCIFH